MGGKSKLRKTIIEMIPDHVCYVEPFFGAGWVFFGKEYKNVTLEHLTEIQRAVRFLYLISQSFAGKGNHYGYGTNTKPSPQIFIKEY